MELVERNDNGKYLVDTGTGWRYVSETEYFKTLFGDNKALLERCMQRTSPRV